MLRRRARFALVAALGLCLAGPPLARADLVTAGVSATVAGPAMGSGFLGASIEYRAVHQYTGRDPRAVNPVLVALLKALTPGQAPVLRIGGNSSDGTWWPIRGMIPPSGIYYPLTPGWLRTTQALAADLGAKLILGINLAAGRPAIAAAEGQALLAGIGRRFISAFEIGNEPDLYGHFTGFRDRRGHAYRRRSRNYGLADYTRQFTQWRHALPRVPLAGPAAADPGWMGKLGRLISSEPRLKLVTYHRYPLRACVTDRSSPDFASIPHLLADRSASGLARGLASFVAVAHRHGVPFRVAEMNSASCEGAPGVSDTFASALWALDAMFNLAGAGVDGVNFHMLPASHYELFSVSHDATGAWQAAVHPEYYGLLMFAQAYPPGARQLPTTAPSGPVKVWATRGADGVTRVVLINKDPGGAHDVQLALGAGPTQASVETLSAPAVSSTTGVTLGGQTFGAETTTGTLPAPPVTASIAASGGAFTVSLPAGSAALLTTSG